MITLLHGDDQSSSREALHAFKMNASRAGTEIRILNGKTLDETVLTQAMESASFFADRAAIIIENLLGPLSKKPKRAEAIAAILRRAGSSVQVILWEDREVGGPAIKLLGNELDVRLFKIPPAVFSFLDALRPGNTRQILSLYQKTLEHIPAEFILSLLVKRLRTIAQCAGGVQPKGMAPWQLARLTKQALFFTMDQILTMKKLLLDAEYATKTGSTPFTLSQHIEQFLITL